MRKILIAGTSSGVGKTTLSMGLMRALKNRNLKVQPFKVGPDYIDTSYHSFATSRKSKNLDSYMLDENIIKYLFNKNSKDTDISVIEGVMGLYDGYGIDLDSCTSSYMSKILKVPVILVIDGGSVSTSTAAMVLGYKNLDPKVNIVGVIVNNLSSQKHFELIKIAIERYTKVKVLGYIPKNLDFSIPSRHLGLIQAVELESLDEKLDLLAATLEKYIDIDEIIRLSESEQVTSSFKVNILKYEGLTIAMAYDKAFNFYYWDNIELLEELGVNVVKFSPLRDESVPKCDGIYIGGGYPEVFAKELENNKAMRNSLKEMYKKGIPIYAECGGLMYLGGSLEDLENNSYEMANILKGKSKMTKALQGFGYSKGSCKIDTIISQSGDTLIGHEFHHSQFISTEVCAYDMEKKDYEEKVIKTWQGGYSKENVVATYLHIHFYSNLNVVTRFLNKASKK